MTEIIDTLQGTTFASFVEGFLDILYWLSDTVVNIFTGISSLVGYATSAISNITGVFTSNSGVVTMMNSAWGAIPVVFRSLAILAIIMSAVFVMVRRM
jgi:hypothetical protein